MKESENQAIALANEALSLVAAAITGGADKRSVHAVRVARMVFEGSKEAGGLSAEYVAAAGYAAADVVDSLLQSRSAPQTEFGRLMLTARISAARAACAALSGDTSRCRSELQETRSALVSAGIQCTMQEATFQCP